VTPLTELEATLLANPDDRGCWLVYADALLERNDPRGEVITLGEKLSSGDASVAARYAERCRAVRWPRGAPFPHMHYRVRFEQMFAELRARPEMEIRTAEIDPPDPAAIPRWQKVAGAAWPAGMAELYSQLSGVRLDYSVKDREDTGGAINIPALDLWDYQALNGELWFDFCLPDSPLHFIRPIDRFVAEAYAVLYLRPAGQPADVAFHYCGERLVPTGFTYREWLELLFRSRGAHFWLDATLTPTRDTTWTGECVAHLARLFPDFDPDSMKPARARPEVRL
jgi:uncharacterized protein (TIGR02996 family)